MQRNKLAPWPRGGRPGAPLSPQQTAIARLERAGLGQRRIARRLAVSVATVVTQRRRLRAKKCVPPLAKPDGPSRKVRRSC